MPTLPADVEHAATTARSGFRYRFTTKHHGGDPKASQWRAALTLDEEFSVFDGADQHELADEDGKLYGVLRDADGDLEYIGVWDEQIAEFPVTSPPAAWHGYPVYPLVGLGPQSRRGERGRPAKVVFERMLDAGVIDPQEKRRLLRGKLA
jgi:hypothetical protein